ncbi:MAG TPA: HAD-IA family hydrolase [Gemmatimonadales bacterium]|nr:HAD-IA family hydrolase [Gemmatimonadales bacterium]
MRRFECSAILFDLDGVLVDSAAWIELQWRRWAVRRGLDPAPFLRVCHGRRAVETIRLAAPELDADAEVARSDPADERDTELLRPVAGAERVLDALPPGAWAVATSGPRVSAIARLRHAGLPIPDVLVCAEDVECGKPSPDVYLRAAARLGIEPARCLVVEDAPAGLDSAAAAGMVAIAVTTTHPAVELSAPVLIPDLTRVHLGRIEHDPSGSWRLEVLVVEVVAPLTAARPFAPTLRRSAATRPFDR